ncbi:MAG TPA: D-aminoacylase, partial [Gemmatimonadaceae bacterium]|nr:D-aminoacylase [Gemmatimonadaceae bacterium]
MRRVATMFALIAFSTAGSQGTPQFDVVIRGGTIYDGTGSKPIVGDVAIRGDSIVAIGASISGKGTKEVNARGLAVAPGFINML